MKKLFIILLILTSKVLTTAQSVAVIGSSWSNSVAANSVSQAGVDHSTTTLTSLSNQSLLDVTGVNASTSWTVSVQTQFSDFSNGLSLWLRKTGDGSSIELGNSFSGTPNFIQLSNLGQYLCNGVKNRNSIPIQYEIRGISVLVPARTYGATVLFTISAL